jgi:putative serine protease PepD
MYDPHYDPDAAHPDPVPDTGPPPIPAPPATPPLTGVAPPPYPAQVYAPPAPPARAPRPNRPRVGFWRLLVAGVLGGVLGATAIGAAFTYGPLARPTATVSTKPATPATIVVNSKDQPIETAAAKILPSVVNVAIQKTTVGPFGSRTSSGNGSGIIVSADGYVLTNNHVVDGADRILVRLGTEDLVAKVVGTDPSSDLAVIKVSRTGLPAAEFGKSADLKVGQTVVAVGSPFGLAQTVTSGIISALHRSDFAESSQDVAAYTNLIQTDAAINPGNSGGALVDLFGRVIGINTLISSPSGQLGTPQSAGIGFAIPIDYAKSIADQIIAGKKVEHPYVGISAVTIDEALAQQYDLPVTSGALIQSVLAGSPAAKAGMQAGDIIVAIGGQPARSFEDVLAVIRSSTIGQAVSVEIMRDGKKQTLSVTLASDQAAQ